MSVPENLKYTKEHEWVEIKENIATIGITDFAQEQLGDIVLVELPEVGSSVEKEAVLGVVESVKSVSDIFAPLAGKVVAVNEALNDNPELVNEGCYGDGWYVKLEINPADASELLDASAYQALLEE